MEASYIIFSTNERDCALYLGSSFRITKHEMRFAISKTQAMCLQQKLSKNILLQTVQYNTAVVYLEIHLPGYHLVFFAEGWEKLATQQRRAGANPIEWFQP